MCKNSLFIPQSVKSKPSFLFYFKIAKELSEFRNYLFKHHNKLKKESQSQVRVERTSENLDGEGVAKLSN